MNKVINIYDIAKEAGVSITTVSRVLNNKKDISEKTKAKVEAVLKKYNYTPNAMARGLVAKSMRSIGVVTTDIRNHYFSTAAFTIEQEFSKLGYNVILCNTGGRTPESISHVKMLAEKKVDGVILIGSVFSDDDVKSPVLSYFSNTPLVVINGVLGVRNTYSILADDSYGIELCVEHLFSKGHRDIVYIKDEDTYSANRKKEGFISAMNKYGLKIDDSSIVITDKGLKGGSDAVEKLISLNKKFSALVFGEDITAVGGLKKIKELGKKVPENVAVTGFNNSTYAECCEPELTSVDNKAEIMGSLSVKLLYDLIENRTVTSNILIRPDLVIRKST